MTRDERIRAIMEQAHIGQSNPFAYVMWQALEEVLRLTARPEKVQSREERYAKTDAALVTIIQTGAACYRHDEYVAEERQKGIIT